MEKEKYTAPKIDVANVKLEEGIANASVQPGTIDAEYEVQETWQEETIQQNVSW